MRYKVDISPQAARSIRRLPQQIRDRILDRLTALEDDPRPAGCERITGIANGYRIRVGDYRVVYEIEDDRLIVLVLRVGHRREVYRRMPS